MTFDIKHFLNSVSSIFGSQEGKIKQIQVLRCIYKELCDHRLIYYFPLDIYKCTESYAHHTYEEFFSMTSMLVSKQWRNEVEITEKERKEIVKTNNGLPYDHKFRYIQKEISNDL